MSPVYYRLGTGALFKVDTSSITVPRLGDIVLRKRTPTSGVDYCLYECPEDWSSNSKTWLLKVSSCSVSYAGDGHGREASPGRVKCMMLLVWEHGRGFTEVPGGGILTPETSIVREAPDKGVGPDVCPPRGYRIALAFTQPGPPEGPTYLRVDFWNEIYFGEEFEKLLLLSIVDTDRPRRPVIRSVTIWRRAGGTWIRGPSNSRPIADEEPATAVEVLGMHVYSSSENDFKHGREIA